MLRAHKIALDPNNKQKTMLAKSAGCARFAWNWALAKWQELYKAGEKPSWMDIRKKLNAIKKEEFPWMSEVSHNASSETIRNLGKGFDAFFAKRCGYPKFKKKGIHDSAYVADGINLKIKNKTIRLPRIGEIRMREALRFEGKLISATVSKEANRWYVSVIVDVPDLITVHQDRGIVGVDLGITTLATLSTGEKIEGPRAMKVGEKRLRMLCKSVSRKKKGSANNNKARIKLAKQYQRMGNIRSDSLHKLTNKLTKNFSVIGIEDLNVAGMIKNKHLSKSIADMGFFEFRRQLNYKALLNGSEVIVVDRFFPSSKLCSVCGFKVDKLNLSIRDWRCSSCGTLHDRDINAAKNIGKEAADLAVTACGVGSAGAKKSRTKLLTKKQEPNTNG